MWHATQHCDACGRKLKDSNDDGLCPSCLIDEQMLREERAADNARDDLWDDED